LKLAQAGDAEALGNLFDHFFDRVFAVVHRFLGHRELAEDITQDIFLKVRRHIGRLDLEVDLAPWLYTVAINACRDHCRSTWWRVSRRSVPLDDHEVAPALVSSTANPERELLVADEERRVRAAVLRLPPDLRISVVLHDFDGLPHDQIARVTGTSHSAARKRHSRALDALAELLQEGTSS
jgi:RNA polymerase sigma-70 factor (ECF subfamily)